MYRIRNGHAYFASLNLEKILDDVFASEVNPN